MLRRCIAHHLGLGCAAIFVSLNRDDEESVAVVHEFSRSTPVQAAPVPEFARSEFNFLTDAVREADRRFRPERILVIDSDEFCVAGSGALDQAPDLLKIPRYNAALTSTDKANARHAEVTLATLVIPPFDQKENQQLARLRPHLRWLTGRIGPKILVRPAAVRSVWRGGHGIDSGGDNLTQAAATDLAIVHFPFTTMERFKDKLAGIRARIGSFGAGEAGHWRTWLRADDEGRLEEVFDAQFFRPNEIVEWQRAGLIQPLGAMLRSRA